MQRASTGAVRRIALTTGGREWRGEDSHQAHADWAVLEAEPAGRGRARRREREWARAATGHAVTGPMLTAHAHSSQRAHQKGPPRTRAACATSVTLHIRVVDPQRVARLRT